MTIRSNPNSARHDSWVVTHNTCKFVTWLDRQNQYYIKGNFRKIQLWAHQPLVKWVPGMSRGSTDHDNQCSMWFLSPCHQHWVIVTKVINYPDSKIHGANMGPIWGRQDPGGPHVSPINFAIWVHSAVVFVSNSWLFFFTHLPTSHTGTGTDAMARWHPVARSLWTEKSVADRLSQTDHFANYWNMRIYCNSIISHVHCFLWEVITHPCHDFNGRFINYSSMP